MTYRGKVQKGVIVLEDPQALAEGTEVNVEPVVRADMEKEATTLGERLMEFAGKAVGLPKDAAENHDHYLYGTPKR